MQSVWRVFITVLDVYFPYIIGTWIYGYVQKGELQFHVTWTQFKALSAWICPLWWLRWDGEKRKFSLTRMRGRKRAWSCTVPSNAGALCPAGHTYCLWSWRSLLSSFVSSPSLFYLPITTFSIFYSNPFYFEVSLCSLDVWERIYDTQKGRQQYSLSLLQESSLAGTFSVFANFQKWIQVDPHRPDMYRLIIPDACYTAIWGQW